MKQHIISLFLVFAFALASSAHANFIDRSALFEGCKKLTESKKYFRALDRKKIKSFYLSNATFSGAGKDNINLILDEIEKRNFNEKRRAIHDYIGKTVFVRI